MPEPVTPEGGNNPSGDTPAAGDEAKQITMTSKQLAERLERAKPADYDDLKAKAARLDELEEASKSEVEKANDRAAAAEAEAAKVPAKVAEALRSHLIELHDIDTDKADLFLTGSEPDLLLRQVKALIGAESDRKKHGNVAPREGDNPTAPTDKKRAFVRGLVDRD